ncbi:MAG: 50S ribosomal protein L32 [Nitrospinales bacterium]
MAVPKKKRSKSKQGHTRSHQALSVPSYGECPQCHETKRPHHVCPHCGYYKDKEVLQVDVV